MKVSFCIACIVVLTIVITLTSRNEAFGMSPGTLDQLSSTSVPSYDTQPIQEGYFLL